MTPLKALFQALLALSLLLAAPASAQEAGRECNMPVTGTLQAVTVNAVGSATAESTPYTVQLAGTSASADNYYTGSTITITGGTGVGQSSRITSYCGVAHTSCEGTDSTGTVQAVSYIQKETDLSNAVVTRTYPSSQPSVASELRIRLPTVDGSGRSITAGAAGIAVCSTALSSPYMTTYSGADCTGTYVNKNIYITRGTGAGQVGLIRAGPDSNLDIQVTGILGYCTGGTDAIACYDNWHRDEQNCQANTGSRCNTDADCTGGPNAQCTSPVDTTSEYTISDTPTSSTCNPLCNNKPSYTATVDFSVTLDTTSTYSISRGCYDERFGAGMRRLGSSGTGAGQQSVQLNWKVLVPDGEIVARPAITADGSVIIGAVKGSLTKVAASGAKMWNIYVGSVVGNPAIGSDGTIYFGSGDRNIWAVTDNGVTRWRYPTPLPVQASPLVTDDAVYIGDRNGTFYRFNLDGSVRWRYYTSGEIWGGAKMTRDGKVVFGSMDTYFYCLDSATGMQLWNYTVGQEIVSTPLIQDVSIVFGTREDEEAYGQVIALKMDGTVRWTYPVTSSVESEPAEGANGVVFVSTVDGKLLAIQADGHLLWKYNTGGTGGVCTRRYGAETLNLGTSVGNGDLTIYDGLDTTVVLASGASTTDNYYKDYRATFKLAEGTLRAGQFRGVQQADVRYVPVSTTTTHDAVFTDSSDQNVAFAVTFTTMDTMIAGESFSISLPGITTTGPVTGLLANAATAALHPGAEGFAGTTGTATAGTHTTITLGGTGCAVNDQCRGATITFLTGTGAGQTAVITQYVHGTLVATISYVAVAPDSTTTYSIAKYTVPKFTAAYANTASDNAAGILTFTVISSVGTADCATGCSNTVIKLATTTAGTTHSTTAAFHDTHQIEFTGGTGAGQISVCRTYTVAQCVMDHVALAPDATTTYKIGPVVAKGEMVTLSTAYGTIKYPHYSGLATGTPSTTEIILATTASGDKDIYTGMEVEIGYITATQATLVGSSLTSLDDTTFDVNNADAATNCKYVAGAYLKVAGSDEIMKIVSLTVGTGGGSLSTIVVQRAQLGTSETLHTDAAAITVWAYSTVTGYTIGTRALAFTAVGIAPGTGDSYRLMGTSADIALLGATKTVGTNVHAGITKVAAVTEWNTATVTLLDESAKTGLNYVGATITITDGRGKGLEGKVTAYTLGSAVASVTWGGAVGDAPKGSNDNGYSTSGFPLSFYTLTAQGTVTGYTGSSLTMTVSPVNVEVSYQAMLCTTYSVGSNGNLKCTANSYTNTPVTIDWAGGAWCEAGGGRGWGATSPCVMNGLVVTTSSNKFVYGLSSEGTVQFKYMTGKRIKSPPVCAMNADKTMTIYTGSSDHFLYRMTADAPRVLRGSSWYSE